MMFRTSCTMSFRLPKEAEIVKAYKKQGVFDGWQESISTIAVSYTKEQTYIHEFEGVTEVKDYEYKPDL